MHELTLIGLQPEPGENPKRPTERVSGVPFRLSTSGAGVLANRQS